MSHIFISYTQDDYVFMNSISLDLENEGIEVWRDDSIKPGDPHWDDLIQQKIKEAICVVVVLSPKAVQSRWVKVEVATAEEIGLPIIPALVHGDPSDAVPLRLKTTDYIDLRAPNYKSGISELIKTIKERYPVDNYDERGRKFEIEKHCIGLYTAYYLRENACEEAVAVDGGTTNIFALERIFRDSRERRSTVSVVMTNHLGILPAVQKQAEEAHPNWYFTGWRVRESRKDFAEGAEVAVAAYEYSMAVVGVNGFRDCVLYTTSPREHLVKKAMIQQAKSVIFPFDASKWGRLAGCALCSLDKILPSKEKVVLLTCYPIRGESEAQKEYDRREETFKEELREFLEAWTTNIRLFLTPLNPNESDAREKREVPKDDLFSVLGEMLDSISKKTSGSPIGLIISIELW
ncbi:MAG TPA: TIR domain-containing protein [Aggregatilineaceae bacterium]|nr:TIR domain-containing protein [Aggregatilineaceae bacterium]